MIEDIRLWLSFILTMRNVNIEMAAIKGSSIMRFILTMRNVNYKNYNEWYENRVVLY